MTFAAGDRVSFKGFPGVVKSRLDLRAYMVQLDCRPEGEEFVTHVESLSPEDVVTSMAKLAEDA